MEKEQRKRLIISRLFTFLAVLFVFMAGLVVGTQASTVKNDLDLSRFWHVYSLISSKYPGDIDKTKIVEGAIRGMIDSLDDPHTSYLSELESQRLEEDLSGRFEGIGAVLTNIEGRTVVVEPIEDSPALKAGLRKDDVIIEVDGESTADMVLEQVVSKIRGPEGTKVSLVVLRGEQEISLEIERGTITVSSVKYERRGNIGVIRISQFGDDTVSAMNEAITELEKQKVSSYLIDLRNNPGGYLGAARRVTGYFLPPGSVVVKETRQGGKTSELKTTGTPLIPTKPVFVFINGGSASSSEILAGALQDYERAVIIGEKSYGKGSVQDLVTLRSGSALRLTIAEWLTPNGRRINKAGIEPDHVITSDTAEEGLNRALEFIRSR